MTRNQASTNWTDFAVALFQESHNRDTLSFGSGWLLQNFSETNVSVLAYVRQACRL